MKTSNRSNFSEMASQSESKVIRGLFVIVIASLEVSIYISIISVEGSENEFVYGGMSTKLSLLKYHSTDFLVLLSEIYFRVDIRISNQF